MIFCFIISFKNLFFCKFWYKRDRRSDDYKIKLCLGDEKTEVKCSSKSEGKEEAAKRMLRQIGPFVEDKEWEKSSAELIAALDKEMFKDWDDPVFDARHVPMKNKDGDPLKGIYLNYESYCQ